MIAPELDPPVDDAELAHAAARHIVLALSYRVKAKHLEPLMARLRREADLARSNVVPLHRSDLNGRNANRRVAFGNHLHLILAALEERI